jgi:HlyD family secretion protein
VIVTLDAGDLAARVLQAQATLASQEAQLAQARARKDAAEHTAERAKKLAEHGAGTTQLSEDAAAAARESTEGVRAAEGLLAQSEAALKLARVSRAKAELTAPFDGMLVEVHPDPGEELAPATPVFEIIDDSRLHVDASIDEADVGRLKVGQPAQLKLDALPNRPIEGALAKIGPAVRKDAKGARTLPVEVQVNDVKAATDLGLRSGMSANVDIRVAEKPNVVSLPTNVIIGRGAKRHVFRVENGKAVLRPVEIGLSSWDRSEVLSGVSVGDEVIATLNVKELEDGALVTTTPTAAK